MRYLILLPLLLFMSCSVFQPQASNKEIMSMNKVSLRGTSWELDSLIDFTPEKLTNPVTLTFGADENNSAYGYGGCNYYNGKYTKTSNRIAFSHLLSTKKYCFLGSKTETKMISVLLSSNRVGMDKEDRLLLMEDRKVIAVFHKTEYKGE